MWTQIKDPKNELEIVHVSGTMKMAFDGFPTMTLEQLGEVHIFTFNIKGDMPSAARIKTPAAWRIKTLFLSSFSRPSAESHRVPSPERPELWITKT